MIRFEALTKRFGRHLAVGGLTLAIRPGEVVALLGPNGSGKTTALKAAVGLVRATSGRVLVGDPALPAGDAAARRTLSFLPQKVGFPESLTGAEVLEFYRRLRGAPAERVAEVLRMAELNGAAGRAVGTYSGGMVQRLGLAVAALPDARAVLLDEPTSSLDAEGIGAFYALAERWRDEGRAVLFSSHQLGDVERLAERIAVLVDGRLVGELSQEALSERLSARGLLRVRVAACPADLVDRLAAIAPGSRRAGEELVVPGPARTRAAALEAIRAARVEIRGLAAEEGRLDALWRELAGAAAIPTATSTPTATATSTPTPTPTSTPISTSTLPRPLLAADADVPPDARHPLGTGSSR